MKCPDENRVLDLIQGRLSGASAQALDGHLDACQECRWLVAEFLRRPSGLASAPASSLGTAPTLVSQPPSEHGRVSALPPGTRVGRYVVVERIGQGGMGVVYAAHDPELDRRISLKLLRTDRRGKHASEGRARLVREAQALARLSHPNVVAVHDVGTWEEQVFIAMELVPGGTLARWLEQPHPWRETLGLFIRAGRGLAAAHAAGLVHRDFKPENVLVGQDGRVRVTDFGLARPDGMDSASRDEDTPPPSAESPLALAITQAGAVVGTPRYMAPEQLAGGVADARSDQFSFCISLYEGLYGERPFGGDTVRALTLEVLEGRLRAAPRGSPVPARIRRVLLRGLSTASRERFATLDELLDALEHDPSRRRRRLAALGGAALVSALAVVAAMRVVERPRCEAGAARLTGVWDGAVRARLEPTFLGTGRPYAPVAWQRTAASLDAYANGWRQLSQEICEATHVRHEQSQETAALRMACMDERRAELAAFTGLLSTPDGVAIERAPVAAAALPPLSRCSDLAALASRIPPPANEEARAKVTAGRERLASARAILNAGSQYAPAIPIAEEVLAQARAVGYRPLEADALSVLSNLQERSGKPREAEKTLHLAIQALEASHDDEGAARAWVGLVNVTGTVLERTEEARTWVGYAAAAVERAGNDAELQARLQNALGLLEQTGGNFQAAISHHERAIKLRLIRVPPDDPRMTEYYANLGIALERSGKLEEALATYKRALAIDEQALGPDHPRCAGGLHNLSAVLIGLNEHEQALTAIDRAVRIREGALGKDHHKLAALLINRGIALKALGRYDEALSALHRAEEVSAKAFGPNHPQVLLAREDVARVLSKLGRQAEALAIAQAALQVRQDSNGAGPSQAESHTVVGHILIQQKRHAEAIEHFSRAVALDEKASGPESVYVSEDLLGLGESQLGAGQSLGAIKSLERALAIRRKQPRSENGCAVISISLARALVAARQEPRAVALAQAAVAQLATAPPYFADALAEGRALLRVHARAGGPSGGGR